MTSVPSLLKRLYDAVAMFAVLNALGAVALVGLLVASGALDGEKARRMVAVLRGTALEQCHPAASGRAGEAHAEKTGQGIDEEGIPASSMELEIRRLEAERIQTELDQRLALNNSILLRVTAEREKFQKEKDAAAKEQQLAAEHRSSEGFQKQVAIFESLSPKVAAEHLLSMAEPDQAARILVELNPRKAKAIVEQVKTGSSLEKMRTILQRVKEVAPVRLVELDEEQQ